MMARIYVSSTFSDLEEYRAKVIHTINGMADHKAVAMEYYPAADRPPVEKCLADVAGCEVYVGIFAWRYGYIPFDCNPEGKSITELEYRYAQEKNIPCLIFLVDTKADWPLDRMDYNNEEGGNGEYIKKFRKNLETDLIVSYFANLDDLAANVYKAINELIAQDEEHTHEKGSIFEEEEVQEAVNQLRANFSVASKQIFKISQYKKIHDCFQQLENSYKNVENHQYQLSEKWLSSKNYKKESWDDMKKLTWENIRGQELDLQNSIKDLIDQAHEAKSVLSDSSWIEILEEAQTEIGDAVRKKYSQENEESLKTGMHKLRGVIGRYTTQMNTLLFATASVLEFGPIVDNIKIILDRLTQPDQDATVNQEFVTIATSLQELHPQFKTLIHEHNQWQIIEDDLRVVEANLEAALAFEWDRIMKKVKSLIQKRQEEWVRTLMMTNQRLKDSLNNRSIFDAKDSFHVFRSESSRQFNRVDHDLLKLTDKLEKDGKNLNSWLRGRSVQ